MRDLSELRTCKLEIQMFPVEKVKGGPMDQIEMQEPIRGTNYRGTHRWGVVKEGLFEYEGTRICMDVQAPLEEEEDAAPDHGHSSDMDRIQAVLSRIVDDNNSRFVYVTKEEAAAIDWFAQERAANEAGAVPILTHFRGKEIKVI